MTREKFAQAVAGLRVFLGPVMGPERASPHKLLERPEHLKHCAWMLGEMMPLYDAGRVEKAMRWLGYVQGVFVALCLCTLNDVKELNKPDGAATEDGRI